MMSMNDYMLMCLYYVSIYGLCISLTLIYIIHGIIHDNYDQNGNHIITHKLLFGR